MTDCCLHSWLLSESSAGFQQGTGTLYLWMALQPPASAMLTLSLALSSSHPGLASAPRANLLPSSNTALVSPGLSPLQKRRQTQPPFSDTILRAKSLLKPNKKSQKAPGDPCPKHKITNGQERRKNKISQVMFPEQRFPKYCSSSGPNQYKLRQWHFRPRSVCKVITNSKRGWIA